MGFQIVEGFLDFTESTQKHELTKSWVHVGIATFVLMLHLYVRTHLPV